MRTRILYGTPLTPCSQTFLFSWGSRRTSEVPCEVEVQSVIYPQCRTRPARPFQILRCLVRCRRSRQTGCSFRNGEGDQHTMAWCANALISLMARGALFLKVTPCSCSRTTQSAPSSENKSMATQLGPCFVRRAWGNVPACACGWCTRGRPRPGWRTGQTSAWTTFLQQSGLSLELSLLSCKISAI